MAPGAGFRRGSLGVVGILSSLGCWQRHPGVKTGVDHYHLEKYGYLHIPIQHYSCLDSRFWMGDTSGAGDCCLFLGMSDGVGAGGSCKMRLGLG